jgi:ferritin
MITKKMQDAINEQIKMRLLNYLYLSMSAHFETNNLAGFAKWLRVQYEEECRSTKTFDHVNERGGHIKLLAMPEPQSEWDTALDIFNRS